MGIPLNARYSLAPMPGITPVPTDSSISAPISHNGGSPFDEKRIETIGIAFSGGGFRATLFHLGVMRFLYEAELLDRVRHVCSVSGGSVLSAHLLLNWQHFVSPQATNPSAFSNATLD